MSGTVPFHDLLSTFMICLPLFMIYLPLFEIYLPLSRFTCHFRDLLATFEIYLPHDLLVARKPRCYLIFLGILEFYVKLILEFVKK